MNFLVDAQLPPGLARWLADQGHLAQHFNDVGLTVPKIPLSAIMHFASMPSSSQKTRTLPNGPHERAVGPVIVWLRIGNATNRALLEWLEPRWSSVVQLLIDDNRLIEVR